MSSFSRRQFITASAVGGAGCLLAAGAGAIEPFKRVGPPRIMTSLCAYSFRDYFKESLQRRAEPKDPARALDMFSFLDYCAETGFQGAELTSYYFPKDVSADYLRQVRRHAFLRGVAVSGTSVGNNFTLPAGEKRQAQIDLVKKWVDHALILGAPYLRVFAGTGKEITQSGVKQLCIAALEECADYAGTRGVMLGMENHGGIDAKDVLEIVHSINSKWFGLNLDVGNFTTEDPYYDLAQCAPYAINSHWKSEIKRRGASQGEPSDFARLIKMFRDAGYHGYLSLEYEAKDDPYIAVPRILKQTRELISAA